MTLEQANGTRRLTRKHSSDLPISSLTIAASPPGKRRGRIVQEENNQASAAEASPRRRVTRERSWSLKKSLQRTNSFHKILDEDQDPTTPQPLSAESTSRKQNHQRSRREPLTRHQSWKQQKAAAAAVASPRSLRSSGIPRTRSSNALSPLHLYDRVHGESSDDEEAAARTTTTRSEAINTRPGLSRQSASFQKRTSTKTKQPSSSSLFPAPSLDHSESNIDIADDDDVYDNSSNDDNLLVKEVRHKETALTTIDHNPLYNNNNNTHENDTEFTEFSTEETSMHYRIKEQATPTVEPPLSSSTSIMDDSKKSSLPNSISVQPSGLSVSGHSFASVRTGDIALLDDVESQSEAESLLFTDVELEYDDEDDDQYTANDALDKSSRHGDYLHNNSSTYLQHYSSGHLSASDLYADETEATLNSSSRGLSEHLQTTPKKRGENKSHDGGESLYSFYSRMNHKRRMSGKHTFFEDSFAEEKTSASTSTRTYTTRTSSVPEEEGEEIILEELEEEDDDSASSSEDEYDDEDESLASSQQSESMAAPRVNFASPTISHGPNGERKPPLITVHTYPNNRYPRRRGEAPAMPIGQDPKTKYPLYDPQLLLKAPATHVLDRIASQQRELVEKGDDQMTRASVLLAKLFQSKPDQVDITKDVLSELPIVYHVAGERRKKAKSVRKSKSSKKPNGRRHKKNSQSFSSDANRSKSSKSKSHKRSSSAMAPLHNSAPSLNFGNDDMEAIFDGFNPFKENSVNKKESFHSSIPNLSGSKGSKKKLKKIKKKDKNENGIPTMITVVKDADVDDDVDKAEDTLRGLEPMLFPQVVDDLRLAHVKAVLRVQESSNHPDRLRRASAQSSRPFRHMAEMVAKYDTQQSLQAVLSKWGLDDI